MTDPRSQPLPTDAWPQGIAQPSAPQPSAAKPPDSGGDRRATSTRSWL